MTSDTMTHMIRNRGHFTLHHIYSGGSLIFLTDFVIAGVSFIRKDRGRRRRQGEDDLNYPQSIYPALVCSPSPFICLTYKNTNRSEFITCFSRSSAHSGVNKPAATQTCLCEEFTESTWCLVVCLNLTSSS